MVPAGVPRSVNECCGLPGDVYFLIFAESAGNLPPGGQVIEDQMFLAECPLRFPVQALFQVECAIDGSTAPHGRESDSRTGRAVAAGR